MLYIRPSELMYRRINKLLGTDYESNDEIDWYYISEHQVLNEDFIREFKDEVIWDYISAFQVLSEPFIREFSSKINWTIISRFQALSEDFIREFKDKVSWVSISIYQVLSWKFILDFRNKVDWKAISFYQPYIDSSYEKVYRDYLNKNKLYHLYQQTKNRGWFVGYVNKERLLVLNRYYGGDKEIKVRIFWKDLVLLDKVDKFELIRKFKYV